MSDRFSLQPFSSTSVPIEIQGNIARTNTLAIRYELIGDLAKLEIPATDIPTRKDELWQETCLEFFLGIKNSPEYWEFNISPAGHWNVYHFEDYRQGMQAQKAFTSLPFRVKNQSNCLSLELEIDLAKIILPYQPIELSVTAVIKSKDGEVTYWALTHCGQQADFHLRDSFTIEL